MGKPFVRFYPIDIARLAWQQVGACAPIGVCQKILVTDPANGSVTRLLKAEPKVDQGIFSRTSPLLWATPTPDRGRLASYGFPQNVDHFPSGHLVGPPRSLD